jgi:hypothetical protein
MRTMAGRIRRRNVTLDNISPLDHLEQELTTTEARDILRRRLEEKSDPKGPKTFQEVLDSGRLSLPFLQSSEAHDQQSLEQTLRKVSDPEMSVKISRLLREAKITTIYPSELLRQFESSLQLALDALAEENEMNRIRVKSIRSGAESE